MAPLEGLTVHTYRNAFHKVFGGIDKYFTPFIEIGRAACRERVLRLV